METKYSLNFGQRAMKVVKHTMLNVEVSIYIKSDLTTILPRDETQITKSLRLVKTWSKLELSDNDVDLA